MAYEIPGMIVSLIAGADLSAQQYHFVKLSADNTVVICAAVTDVPMGILQNKPDAAGKVASVLVWGVSKIRVGAVALTYSLAVGTNATGEAITQAVGDTTHYNCGRVLEGAGIGDLCTAMINCQNPLRNR